MRSNQAQGGDPQVLFIGGSGRSGSTLLDRIIGQLPGYVSAGEIRDVWRAGVRENRLCGCGRPFSDCDFWTRVGETAFGGWSNVDVDAADRWMGSYGYRDALTGADAAAHEQRSALVRSLYRAVSDAADGATVVDSSKSPPYGAMLATTLPGSVRAIHLVRDSRGVAFSWGKHVKRPDTPGRDVEMHRLGPVPVATRWVVHNLIMEGLGRRVPSARARYETLMVEPRREIDRVMERIGAPVGPDGLDFIAGSQAQLRPNHTVMGNPMRMAVGPVDLRLDDAWTSKMATRDRLTVTAITWPMLLRYGYRP